MEKKPAVRVGSPDGWIDLPLSTTAEQVEESPEKQFISEAEKATYAAKLDASKYTANDILSKLKTVDGAGSGLDADTLDGKNASDFLLTSSSLDATKLVGALDATKLTGVVPIASIPPAAIERLHIVANQSARFALTSAIVQTGDTVKEEDTGKMYYVTDDTRLNSSAGYEEYSAGSAASVSWGGITGKPSTISGYGITDAATKAKATTSADGLMSKEDKDKVDKISSGAEVNQNAFSVIKVGSTNISADAKTDTVELVAGSNVILTPDATNDKITISATGEAYGLATASSSGLMSNTDKKRFDEMPKITISEVEPENPKIGDLWLKPV